MTTSERVSAWSTPEQDSLRRRWAALLAGAGEESPWLQAALTATAARLRLNEAELSNCLNLRSAWIARPAPSTRPPHPRNEQPMITEDRFSDLHHFMVELTELTRKYGLELSDDEEDGLIVYDQEHDAILAHHIRFDDPVDEYHFSPYWNGWREPTVPA